MREVTAVCKVEAEQLLTRVHQCHQNSSVGLCARVRLNVRELCTEEFLRTVARQILDDVDVLATAVVTTSRVALGVLVGQDAALSLQNRAGNEVLRRDHLERVALTSQFTSHRLGDFGVEFGE